MATRNFSTSPLSGKERQQLRELMTVMRELSRKHSRTTQVVRQSTHDYNGHKVNGWKCNEFMYKKDPCPLPTRARGLFTGKANGEDVILARGYDKFFNISEVPWTEWGWIETHTRGPFEVTVKEDGCLILAAGIDDGKALLVTSKHAINVPHAEVGMRWMRRHLAEAGKTVEELAGFLHENNATAVFELCDDDFEEHVLEYPERARGLYLHGLNRNAAELDTWPSAEVTKIAGRFGFHATEYFTFDGVAEVRAFTDQVRRDQVLAGRAIEGFVVRCEVAADGRPFMFKIKYDEPYLMFREWREVTNLVRNNKPHRTRYPMTKHYVAWLRTQLRLNPRDFAQFGDNKGVIGARNRFLEHYQKNGGSISDVCDQVAGEVPVLLMPVATVGCGKTTVSLALANLFGFGHVQNDNITTKRNPRAAFHQEIMREFGSKLFVIADRMNHVPMLRQTLVAAIREQLPDCHIVALYWPHDRAPHDQILEKTVARVLNRGESHQSLTPQRTPQFRRIMRGNVERFVPLDLESESDCAIGDVIEMDPLAESAENLQRAVDGLCALFPDALKRPSPDEVAAALEKALEYAPTVRKDVNGSKGKDKSAKGKGARGQGSKGQARDVQEQISAGKGQARDVRDQISAGKGQARDVRDQISAGKGQDRDVQDQTSSGNDQASPKDKAKAKAKGKKAARPLFFGLAVQDLDVGSKVRSLVHGDAGQDICSTLMAVGDRKSEWHITLAHVGSAKGPDSKAIYGECQELLEGLEGSDAVVADCTADYIVCNGSVMALRVRTMTARDGVSLPDSLVQGRDPQTGRALLASVNAIPHITLCVGNGAKPVQSNNMLAAVFGPENADRPKQCPDGWVVIPASLAFSAVLKAFMH
ncbi:trna ligase [Coemansia javaensis]|uniref:tRNA ligase n=1 Tax=Coemansia javaensis TaxID=2761396 RepID=A0A9W8HDQ0_9FUNG|nr:trna ligase [Coemansia javaensis]